MEYIYLKKYFVSRNQKLKSKMSVTSVEPSLNCITDCSILNQTSCQLVSRKSLLVDKEVEAELWSKNGCYNSTLFQSTQGYRVYQQVTIWPGGFNIF